MEHAHSRGAKSGLCDLSPSQILYRFMLLLGRECGRREDVAAERFFEMLREAFFGMVKCLAQLGEIHGQLRQHVGILRTLAWKQEGNFSSVRGGISGVVNSSGIVQALL